MEMTLFEKILKCDFEALAKHKGYSYFTKGDYNINLIGVRSKESVIQQNKFDDAIVLDYSIGPIHYRNVYKATTDPGITYLKKPLIISGCAIVVPGQYKGVFKLGKHQGKYEALVQNKPIKVYRDNNRDNILNFNKSKIEEGMFGINMHKAGTNSEFINNWSAGCQVFKVSEDYLKAMAVIKKSIRIYGNSMTYTLYDEKDLDNFITK